MDQLAEVVHEVSLYMRISRSKFLDVRRIEREEFQALFPCGDSERLHVYISPCGRRLTNRPHLLKRDRLAERARSPIMRPSRLNRAYCWRPAFMVPSPVPGRPAWSRPQPPPSENPRVKAFSAESGFELAKVPVGGVCCCHLSGCWILRSHLEIIRPFSRFSRHARRDRT